MRIGVITDAHANLPATVAAFAAMDAAKCDLIVHCGDAIGIGPHPREVLELLLGRADLLLLMGNHDELFPYPEGIRPSTDVTRGEVAHVHWQHDQLDDAWRGIVAQWPYSHDLTCGGKSIRFQHYALNDGSFGPVSRDNVPAELDAAFCPETDIVFFGHHHVRADVQGKAHYINPGALGTNPANGARYALIDELSDGGLDVSLHAAPYDAESVRHDLLDRHVPEAELILRVFLGG